jgi:hypothetical protein
MAAARTLTELSSRWSRKKLIASEAEERGLASFQLEPQIITPIVVEPQTEKPQRDQNTVNYRPRRQIEHVVEIGERQNKEQDYRDRILANLKAKKRRPGGRRFWNTDGGSPANKPRDG